MSRSREELLEINKRYWQQGFDALYVEYERLMNENRLLEEALARCRTARFRLVDKVSQS